MKYRILMLCIIIGMVGIMSSCGSASQKSSSTSDADIQEVLKKLALFRAEEEEKEELAQITIQDDSIYYTGDINRVSYLKFQEVVEGADIPLKKIIVKSGGGDTVYGRKIGNYIFDNNLDVEVDEVCFSSCANYIFPSGKNKIINKGAIVGWHGSDNQRVILAEKENISVRQFIKNEFKRELKYMESKVPEIKKVDIEKLMDMITEKPINDMKEEQEFFDKIGVNINLALYGIYYTPSEGNSAKDNYIGWTYPIEGIEKFGVKNVTYLGGSYPPAKEDIVIDDFKTIIYTIKVNELNDITRTYQVE